MAPFWISPRWLALPIWNVLNVVVPLVAVYRLCLSENAKSFIFLFVALDFLLSLQDSQSSGLVAGLMIGTFVAFESDNPILAALFVGLNFHIKIFGIAVAIMFILYKNRMSFVVASTMFVVGLGLLPAILIGIGGLAIQYESWLNLLKFDHLVETNNLSLIGFVNQWL